MTRKRRMTTSEGNTPSGRREVSPSEDSERCPPKSENRANGKTEEEIWQEREKRLEELLEKDGGPNPEAKEDFNRLLEETVRRNSR